MSQIQNFYHGLFGIDTKLMHTFLYVRINLQRYYFHFRGRPYENSNIQKTTMEDRLFGSEI